MLEQFTEQFQIRSKCQKESHLFKYFLIPSLKIKRKTQQILSVSTYYGRRYEIKGPKVQELLQILNQYQILRRIGHNTQVNLISIPKNANYQQFYRTQQSTKQQEIHIQILEDFKNQKKISFPKQKSYLLENDWAINSQNGGLILVSQEKKKNQGKIIKVVVKKIVTTGSFMGISFPVFAMKPQSILQTYCKSIATAPLIFKQCPNNSIQRIKRFIAFIFSFSRLFSDMDKPFNPTLGQTFQSEIADGLYSAEQISHHPPQSSIYYEGKGFKIYAILQLIAQIGLNSATGYFNGDVIVQFQNGEKVIGKLLAGQMSGFLLGENKFRPDGSYYVYDSKNNYVGLYKRQYKDIFRGYIGILQDSSRIKFNKAILSKDRFSNFETFSQKDFVKIDSQLDACWTRNVTFDRKTYIDFNDASWLPYQPTYEGIQILQSDSRFRDDIKLKKMGKDQQAQKQKEKIEQDQRNLRKLRLAIAQRKNHKHQ